MELNHRGVADVSQPSLGVEGEAAHGGREGLDTPPLSPMYSGVDSSSLSVTPGRSKPSASFLQKSAGTMETHWEEDVPHKSRKNLEAG